MFPRHVIDFVALRGGTESVPERGDELANAHHGVSILFMDIVGFTSLAKEADPRDVMAMLNNLFSTFDSLCHTFGVYKVRGLDGALLIWKNYGIGPWTCC